MFFGEALGVATLPFYASFSPAPRLLMKQGNGKTSPSLRPSRPRS